MDNELFDTNRYQEVEQKVAAYLNSRQDYLSVTTVKSTRAVGDAIQDLIAGNFKDILGDFCAEYFGEFGRKGLADLAFRDFKGFYYAVDVKNHRLDTEFNMPNLTSVKRLAAFYKDPQKYFVLLLVSYKIIEDQAVVEKVRFVPIEFLGWDCLTLGALGEGQIQIKKTSNLTLHPGYSRKTWMIELCDKLLKFYPKEISKIQRRIKEFEAIKTYWESQIEDQT